MNISHTITRNCSFYPQGMALISGDDGRKFTWSEFNKKVNQLGNALLGIGVKKGDLVAIYLPNSPEFVFAFYAIMRIGAVALPFNILYRSREITYIMDNSGAEYLIGASHEVNEYLVGKRTEFTKLKEIITVGDPVSGCRDLSSLMADASENLETLECYPDDMALLMYTSGTCGQPKGAMLSHNNLLVAGDINTKLLHINDQDLLLSGAPYCHIFCVLSLIAPIIAGAAIVTMKRFSPEKCLELISNYRVTHFCGVPTMYIYMMGRFNMKKFHLHSWRFAHSAGASMPMECVKKIEEKFGVYFCESYGITETSSTITYNRLGHTRLGSVGVPAMGIQVKVADELGNTLPPGELGEILVKGAGVFKGYWQMPEATVEAFLGPWYRTGDLGRYDQDGYYYVVDRKKDMIISGGYNIYPREVEEVIYHHPKVKEAAVIGVNHLALNEAPKAYVVLKEGEEMTGQELIQFCQQELACYKLPRYVEFLPELPKTASGKILKRLLEKK